MERRGGHCGSIVCSTEQGLVSTARRRAVRASPNGPHTPARLSWNPRPPGHLRRCGTPGPAITRLQVPLRGTCGTSRSQGSTPSRRVRSVLLPRRGGPPTVSVGVGSHPTTKKVPTVCSTPAAATASRSNTAPHPVAHPAPRPVRHPARHHVGLPSSRRRSLATSRSPETGGAREVPRAGGAYSSRRPREETEPHGHCRTESRIQARLASRPGRTVDARTGGPVPRSAPRHVGELAVPGPGSGVHQVRPARPLPRHRHRGLGGPSATRPASSRIGAGARILKPLSTAELT